MPKWFSSEVLGTFILVFFGTGAVATAVALGAPMGVFQVTAVWGLGLSIGIFLSAQHSGGHLNPAITIAFAVLGDLPKKRVPGYIAAQFTGAFLAACAVFLLFNPSITAFEAANNITRGAEGSEASSMMFGEYFPNPGGKPLTEEACATVPHATALFAEFLGTLLLALAIFGFTARSNKSGPGFLTPLAIGLTLTAILSIIAPLTQAGLNPARDLAPRIFSSIAGWKGIPFSTNGIGWLTAYVITPCLGALCGAFISNRLFSRTAE
jgi:glycerol uptake facilitator protein